MQFNFTLFRARRAQNPQLGRLVPVSGNHSALLWRFQMVKYRKFFSTAPLLTKQIQNTYV